MTVDNPDTPELDDAPGSHGPAVLDPQHVGDIVGALGTLKRSETGNTKSWRRKLRLLLVIVPFPAISTPFGEAVDGPVLLISTLFCTRSAGETEV